MCRETVHIYAGTATTTTTIVAALSYKAPSERLSATKAQQNAHTHTHTYKIDDYSVALFCAAHDMCPNKIPKLYSQDFKIVIRIPARMWNMLEVRE